MRVLFFFMLMSMSLGTFANVVLRGYPLILTENPVTLEKNDQTPFNNIIEIPVVSKKSVCIEYTDKEVYEQNGKMCGYHTVPMTMCVSNQLCQIFYNEEERTCFFLKKVCSKSEIRKEKSQRKFNLQLTNFPSHAFIKLGIDENEKLKIDVEGVNSKCMKKVLYSKNGRYTGAKLKVRWRCR